MQKKYNTIQTYQLRQINALKQYKKKIGKRQIQTSIKSYHTINNDQKIHQNRDSSRTIRSGKSIRSKSIRNNIKLNFKKLPHDWFLPKNQNNNSIRYQTILNQQNLPDPKNNFKLSLNIMENNQKLNPNQKKVKNDSFNATSLQYLNQVQVPEDLQKTSCFGGQSHIKFYSDEKDQKLQSLQTNCQSNQCQQELKNYFSQCLKSNLKSKQLPIKNPTSQFETAYSKSEGITSLQQQHQPQIFNFDLTFQKTMNYKYNPNKGYSIKKVSKERDYSLKNVKRNLLDNSMSNELTDKINKKMTQKNLLNIRKPIFNKQKNQQSKTQRSLNKKSVSNFFDKRKIQEQKIQFNSLDSIKLTKQFSFMNHEDQLVHLPPINFRSKCFKR